MLYGDVNSDGRVNNLDLTALLRWLALPQYGYSINQQNADVNYDGLVDWRDLDRLKMHFARPGIVLGPGYRW